jgi:hypothetical protein
MPKVLERFSSVITWGSGPDATSLPPRSSRAWVNPGGISSTWWETRTVAGHQVLTSAEVESGRRLVEQEQLRVGHQRAGDLYPLALPLAQSAEGAGAEVPDADLLHQLRRPVVVEVVVLLPPAADHAVRRRHDHVVHHLVARDPLRQRGAGEPDPGSEVEDINSAEDLVEDPGDARGRVDLGGGDLEQGRLAGAVGAQDHPSLVVLDGPGDGVDEGCLAAAHGDFGELEHGGHGRNPRALFGAYPHPP